MANICAAADGVRSPAVVRIADEVIVVPQSYAQTAVAVAEPVAAAGMMNEDQADCTTRRINRGINQSARSKNQQGSSAVKRNLNQFSA